MNTPQSVSHLEPEDTHALRHLLEMPPPVGVAPREYLRSCGYGPASCRRAADLLDWSKTRIVGALIALARCFDLTDRKSIDTMAQQRLPEAGPEELHHAALISFTMSPAGWSAARAPSRDYGVDVISENARNRPGQQTHWPMTQKD